MAEPTDTGLKVDQGALGKRYQKSPQPIRDSEKNLIPKAKSQSKDSKMFKRGKDTVELSAAYYKKKAEEEDQPE